VFFDFGGNMKKVLVAIISIIFALTMLFSVTGCGVMDTGSHPYFRFTVYDNNGKLPKNSGRPAAYAVVNGLTKLGREQKVLEIPAFFEGVPVKKCGNTLEYRGLLNRLWLWEMSNKWLWKLAFFCEM